MGPESPGTALHNLHSLLCLATLSKLSWHVVENKTKCVAVVRTRPFWINTALGMVGFTHLIPRLAPSLNVTLKRQQRAASEAGGLICFKSTFSHSAPA